MGAYEKYLDVITRVYMFMGGGLAISIDNYGTLQTTQTSCEFQSHEDGISWITAHRKMDNNRETHIPTYWSYDTCLPMQHYGRKEVEVHVFQ